MNFWRLFLVVTIVTSCGGAFGALVGSLIGYAAPNFLEVVFAIEVEKAHEDAQRHEDSSTKLRAGAGFPEDKTDGMTGVGAAMGGAMGLIFGAVIALVLGVIDQIIVLARGRRKPGEAGGSVDSKTERARA